ncbi:hypothetical protein WR25_07330 [Diploscapter pachys]|uniref:Uncharacterized protein n=1 Tax=Diploscapter pachys TaxID=2018661 RepID=A0A2A2KB14_9BILA|nr:hypothetical protein WR25_07330 [Diploscapter pachys]
MSQHSSLLNRECMTYELNSFERADDDPIFITKKTGKIVFWTGICVSLIGGAGYVYTISELVYRSHKKLAEKHHRKLEVQIANRKKPYEIERKKTLEAERAKSTLAENQRF